MKKGIILLWFVILLCVLQRCSALGDLHRLLKNNVSSFQLVAQNQPGKHNLPGQLHGAYLETQYYHSIETRKAQKGKGTYGGANVVHKKPNSKSAASVLNIGSNLLLLLLLLPYYYLIA